MSQKGTNSKINNIITNNSRIIIISIKNTHFSLSYLTTNSIGKGVHFSTTLTLGWGTSTK